MKPRILRVFLKQRVHSRQRISVGTRDRSSRPKELLVDIQRGINRRLWRKVGVRRSDWRCRPCLTPPRGGAPLPCCACRGARTLLEHLRYDHRRDRDNRHDGDRRVKSSLIHIEPFQNDGSLPPTKGDKFFQSAPLPSSHPKSMSPYFFSYRTREHKSASTHHQHGQFRATRIVSEILTGDLNGISTGRQADRNSQVAYVCPGLFVPHHWDRHSSEYPRSNSS